jgi:hypothetical protein
MDKFSDMIGPQLVNMGMPLQLHAAIIEKIRNDVVDASNYVVFAEKSDDGDNDDEEIEPGSNSGEEDDEAALDLSIRFPDQPYALVAIHNIEAHYAAFIIDHMWYDTYFFFTLAYIP